MEPITILILLGWTSNDRSRKGFGEISGRFTLNLYLQECWQ
jgi:hypothetical protein